VFRFCFWALFGFRDFPALLYFRFFALNLPFLAWFCLLMLKWSRFIIKRVFWAFKRFLIGFLLPSIVGRKHAFFLWFDGALWHK
jgi:hypothetical protein